MDTPDPVAAHQHSSNHRAEVLAGTMSGCFHCTATFQPGAIVQWIDLIDGVGGTALCPLCGIDSVIGSASGFPITETILRQMEAYWFGSM